ncbi:U8 snoRNA-decapping enzyme [Betta splendens]|uniref:U8 snoRNA-decapping enzyme n=1 Tax=Betta splendens TaxID=158456 RepID=A0A6P7N0R6_BETSP|nr:U8 snoRNA-decapping enzyme [Betta splendens]XP_029012862.1 U8 snoRNA-decapping enzyme [Betta splendens]XP_055366354.1 U8 snoRNA-decapping enzyme [Betta splendens]
MASGQMSRAEALARSDCRHACHVMLYSDTKSRLFGRNSMRHIILMQMRFDGLLGFPGGMVNPQTETLEEGLSRELLEELGVAISVSVDDHVESRILPPSFPSSSSGSNLVLHFYVKKIEEDKIKEVERAAVCTAKDHGQEVLGMVRVPLYLLKRGAGGLSCFLSQSFIGNARLQLVSALLRLNLLAPRDVHRALTHSLRMQRQTTEDLRAALALTEA